MKFLKAAFLSLMMLAASSVFAQNPTQHNSSGNITTTTSSCTMSNSSSCVVLPLPGANISSIVITVSGGWSGTLNPIATNAGLPFSSSLSVTPTAGGTSVTTITSNGSWNACVNAQGIAGIYASALTAGTATVTITSSTSSVTCGGGGSSSPTSGNITNNIYAANPTYGLPSSGNYSCVGNMTSGSNQVTISGTTDFVFTAAMQGMRIFGTNEECQGQFLSGTGTVRIKGYICASGGFVNATTVNVCTTQTGATPSNATVTCTVPATQASCQIWVYGGTTANGFSTTALQNAMNDAVAVGNPCKRLILPAGVYGFNAPIKSSTAACTNPVGTVTQNVHSWGVNGQGTGQTYLVLDPDGNYNSPGSNSAIMFDTPGAIGVDFEDFTVTGGGNATCTATTNPTFFFMGGYLSTFRNLDVDNACNNTGTVDAFGFCNGAAVAAGCHIENVNSWNGGFFCGQLWSGSYYNLQCQTQGGVTAMHGNVNTYGSSFLAGQSTNVVTTVGIVWNSYSDTIQNFGSTANMIQNLGTVNLDGTNLTSVASGAILWFNGATAATYHLHNVNFSSGSAKLTTNAAAGSQIIDQCGNLLPGIASSTFTNILFVPCPTMTYTAAVPQVGATGTGSCGTITTQIGNILNGSLKCTAASASATVVLTPGITAQNGWTCTGVDLTTTTATPLQTASNGTTCTLASAGILQNDVIAFSLNQF